MRCIEFEGTLTKEGYGRTQVDGKRMYAHRRVWVQTNGEIPEGLIIRHLCNNPACINIEHLALGTIADNNNDKVLAGTTNRGSKCNLAKLNQEQVLEIRKIHAEGLATQKELAKKYGVHQSAISRIINRKDWGWL